MLREHNRELRWVLLATDIALAGAVFAVGLYFLESLPAASGQALPGWRVLVLGIAAALALPIAIRFLHGETTRLDSLSALTRRLAAAGGVAGVVLAAVAYAVGALVAPAALFACLLGQLLAVGLLRLSILAGLRALRRRGRNYRNVLVIGTGPRARQLKDTIARHPEWGLRLVGFVDEGDSPVDGNIPAEQVYKLIDFPSLLRDQVIDEVITACPRSMLAQLGPVVETCGEAGVPLTVMTDLFGDYLPPPQVRWIGAHATLSFTPVHHNQLQLGMKRMLDIAGASLGLIVSAPVLLPAALAIKLSSRGPVFFRQTRCGKYGRTFGIYKLRTMVCDAEARQSEIFHLNEMDGPVFKVRRDPRVTRVGRYLRTFSIDELPQLWNVLVGDMSLVGPRPPIPEEVAKYENAERRRLSMRPGLTCLWQVSGRNAISFDEWVKLDLDYIDSWSLSNDLKILLLTVPVVLRGTGS